MLRVGNLTARKTVAELGRKLKELKNLNIGNTNITEDCLGMKGKHPGLHLNKNGYSRQASNIISHNRRPLQSALHYD